MQLKIFLCILYRAAFTSPVDQMGDDRDGSSWMGKETVRFNILSDLRRPSNYKEVKLKYPKKLSFRWK